LKEAARLAAPRQVADYSGQGLHSGEPERYVVNGPRETFGLIGRSDPLGKRQALCAQETEGLATMDRSERKAAVSAYKERKAIAGVYAIHCAATEEQWVGAAPDLSTIWTRRAFTLRQGIETNRALQCAWNAHGPESFSFKILEEIDLDELTYGRERALKERIAHWRELLGAAGV
jgi:hypothetical protein